jgi:isoleucyl-tRNA synthetase
MLETWQPLPAKRTASRAAGKWALIREVRAEVSKVLDLRIEGKIGSRCRPRSRSAPERRKVRRCWRRSATTCASCFITPAATRGQVAAEAGRSQRRLPACQVRALLALARGCRRRCGASDLCGRCVSNLHGEGEPRSCA